MLRSLERRLASAEQWALAGLVLFMVLLSFLQVLLRVFFSAGILWADTLLRHLVLWVGFLGAGLAAGADRQFAMDALDRVLEGRTRAWVRLACHAFTAAVCGFLLQASLAFFREEYSHSQALFTAFGRGFQAWIFELILPAGFGLLLVHYLIKSALAFGDAARVRPQ